MLGNDPGNVSATSKTNTNTKTHTKTNIKTKKGENCIHIDNQAEMPSTLDPVYVHIPSIKLNLIFAQLYAV